MTARNLEGYALYYAELKNPSPEERRGDRTTDPTLMLGFWRLRSSAKTKWDTPMAIYMGGKDDGDLNGVVMFRFGGGNKVRNLRDDKEVFDRFAGGWWLSAEPVENAEWTKATTLGFWNDGKPAKEMTDAEKQGIDISPGDNNAPVSETLAEQIVSLAAKLDNTNEPTSQEEAVALAAMLDKMATLMGLAEKERVAEKEPFLKGGRDVDNKWNAIKHPGETAATRGQLRRTAWLKKVQAENNRKAEEENRKREAEAKAERERVAAETAQRLEREAAERRAALVEQEVPEEEIEAQVPTTEAIQQQAAAAAEEQVQAPAPVEAERAVVGTAFGRARGLVKRKVGEVTDAAAFAAHLVKTEDEDTFAFLKKRAGQLARAKVKGIPGIELGTEEK